MATDLYTPFATRMTDKALARLQQQKVGEAAKGAYMGDPGALAELYQLDPTQAQAIDQDIRAAEQQELEETRAAEVHERQQTESQRKWATENRELMLDLGQQIGQFQDFETAKAYADQQQEILRQIPGMEDAPLQELTPEAYEQFKQLALGTTDRSPQGSHYLVKDDEGTLYTASITLDDRGNVQRTVVDPSTGKAAPAGKKFTRVHQLDPELMGQIAGRKVRGQTEEERRQGEIEAGLNSIYMMPDLARAEELLQTVQTGGLRADIDSIRRYFGDESLEVADMGELQVLLANDLISKFELMTGVLSESDMKLLQDISAGTRAPAPVNLRLIQNVIRKAERKINKGYEAAQETGSAFDMREFESYLGEGDDTGAAAGGAPGTSQANPISYQDAAQMTTRPPSGTWVTLQNGTVVQVP